MRDLAKGAKLEEVDFGRRTALAGLIKLGISSIVPAVASASLVGSSKRVRSGPQSAFTAEDERFLEELERASFLFFWEQASPRTGLVKDRSLADGNDSRNVGSTAATGFGLTALCLADRRGFLRRSQARDRALLTLKFLANDFMNEHGFFYHFINIDSGERAWKSELSSIDTAILLCGVLTCGEHFGDPEIMGLVQRVFNRVDWVWMLNGGSTLSQGWKPETGFLRSRWDSYCELMMIYLLGLGSSTHPLPAETWDAWRRPMFEYDGIRYINGAAPLFVNQYSHAWFDFRDRRDRYADYFENSVLATRAQRLFSMSLRKQFPDYNDDLWGITASDSAHGYVAWGGPPPQGPIDGTIVPCAPGGSLPFLPAETLRVLKTIRRRFGEKAWKRYGFVDAFNPLTGWYDSDVIGIDQGITLLMAENARTGFVWKTFTRSDVAQRGMVRAGLKPASAVTDFDQRQPEPWKRHSQPVSFERRDLGDARSAA